MINPSTAGRPDSDDRSERYFEAIGRQQCFDLLESHHLGRIAWQAADLPWTSSISKCGPAGASCSMGVPVLFASPTSWPICGLRTRSCRGLLETERCSSAFAPSASLVGSCDGRLDS